MALFPSPSRRGFCYRISYMAMIRYALLDGEGSKATFTLDSELSAHCHGVASPPLLECEGSIVTLTLDGELTLDGDGSKTTFTLDGDLSDHDN